MCKWKWSVISILIYILRCVDVSELKRKWFHFESHVQSINENKSKNQTARKLSYHIYIWENVWEWKYAYTIMHARWMCVIWTRELFAGNVGIFSMKIVLFHFRLTFIPSTHTQIRELWENICILLEFYIELKCLIEWTLIYLICCCIIFLLAIFFLSCTHVSCSMFRHFSR